MKTRFKHVLILFGARYNHLFHRGIAAYARETRWHLSVAVHTGTKPLRGVGAIDGVLIADDFSGAVLQPLLDSQVPGVSLLVRSDGLAYSQVVGDNASIGRLAGEHFRERGYRHYACAGPSTSLWSALRMDCYREVVKEMAASFAHVKTRSASGLFSSDWEAEQRMLQAQLSALPRPCALFCVNDPLACLVLDACLELELAVPQEVAILGVDDDPLYCESVAIPLSSVRHDVESIGYRAAKQLDRVMTGEEVPATEVIAPLGVAVRQSTEYRAVENPAVLAALRFIDENYHRNIGVSDVAQAAGLTLRTLQHLFREEMHESMVERITAVRLARAQELLTHSPMPAAEVAAKAGFSSSAYFHQIFKRHLKCTPMSYRKASRAQRGRGRRR